MDMIEQEMLSILHECRGLISAPVWEHIKGLVVSGECSVALEELCNYLIEENAYPSKMLIERIASIGLHLKVEPSYWAPLLQEES